MWGLVQLIINVLKFLITEAIAKCWFAIFSIGTQEYSGKQIKRAKICPYKVHLDLNIFLLLR